MTPLGAAGCEERSQEGGALVGQEARLDERAVVEAGLAEDVEDAAGRTRLRVRRAVDDAPNAREHDRPRAHRARLERHVEDRVGDPPAAERRGCRAQRDDLGVRRRVAAKLTLVAGLADRLPPDVTTAPIGTSPCAAAASASSSARAIAALSAGLNGESTVPIIGQPGARKGPAGPLLTSNATGRGARGHPPPGNFGLVPVLFRARAARSGELENVSGTGVHKALACAALACAALGLAALALPAPAIAGIAPSAAPHVPGQVVVGLRDGGRRVVELAPGETLAGRIDALERRPGIAYAAPNYLARTAINPLDGGSAGVPGGWRLDQWNFLAAPGGIRVDGAWDQLIEDRRPGGTGVTIAVVDTGVAYTSAEGGGVGAPDFATGQFVPGIDFVDDDDRPLDENGHGTHVAATLGEQLTTRPGQRDPGWLTGVAYGAKLMPVRVLDASGAGSATDVAQGIAWAAKHGADVINVSLQFDKSIGSCEEVPEVCAAVRKARRRGSLVIAAAGNALSGIGKPGALFPAAAPGALSVGATTEHGCIADYSYFGNGVDLVAPGGGPPRVEAARPDCAADGRPILALTLGCFPGICGLGSYGDFAIRPDTGTSMAAAHVSGVAALVIAAMAAGRDPSPRALVGRLLCTARPVEPKRFFRAGQLDALRAVKPKQCGRANGH